jgi:site-specific DNA recombinase
VDAIAKGLGDPAVLGPKSTELNEERKRVQAELEQAPPAPEVVALHPAVLARYEQQIENLQETLASCIASGETEAAQAMRDLVQSAKVFRDDSKPGGVIVEITGRLNNLLGEKAYPNKLKGVWGSVVAEEGLEPPTRGL